MEEEITIKVKSLGGGEQQELSVTVPKNVRFNLNSTRRLF